MTQNGLIYLTAVDIKPRAQQIQYVYNIYGKGMSRDVPISNVLAICREVLNRDNWEVLHIGKCFISRDVLLYVICLVK